MKSFAGLFKKKPQTKNLSILSCFFADLKKKNTHFIIKTHWVNTNEEASNLPIVRLESLIKDTAQHPLSLYLCPERLPQPPPSLRGPLVALSRGFLSPAAVCLLSCFLANASVNPFFAWLHPKSVIPYPPCTQKTSHSLPLHSHNLCICKWLLRFPPILLSCLGYAHLILSVLPRWSCFRPLFILITLFWTLSGHFASPLENETQRQT